MKVVIVILVFIAVLVTVGGLYATGPKRKVVGRGHCRTVAPDVRECKPGHWERTSAFERIKGALTGNP